jgi:ATP-dependent helicase HrpB
VRLWTAADHAARLPRETPEIRRLELSATALELRAWGAPDLASFGWLDAPRPAAVAQAEALLVGLGGLDDAGAITPLGRELLTIAAPPRIARLLVEARRRSAGEPGALLAALAAERDILLEARAFGGGDAAPWPEGPSDLLLRAELFGEAEQAGFGDAICRRLGLDRGALRAAERARNAFRERGRPARGVAAGDAMAEQGCPADAGHPLRAGTPAATKDMEGAATKDKEGAAAATSSVPRGGGRPRPQAPRGAGRVALPAAAATSEDDHLRKAILTAFPADRDR